MWIIWESEKHWNQPWQKSISLALRESHFSSFAFDKFSIEIFQKKVFEFEKCPFLNRSKFRQKYIGTIIRALVQNPRAQSEIKNLSRLNKSELEKKYNLLFHILEYVDVGHFMKAPIRCNVNSNPFFIFFALFPNHHGNHWF